VGISAPEESLKLHNSLSQQLSFLSSSTRKHAKSTGQALTLLVSLATHVHNGHRVASRTFVLDQEILVGTPTVRTIHSRDFVSLASRLADGNTMSVHYQILKAKLEPPHHQSPGTDRTRPGSACWYDECYLKGKTLNRMSLLACLNESDRLHRSVKEAHLSCS
jgi:hypothetical protein